ncbi:unnamed protein product [Lactuca virosa]|uniref:Pentatricopeptide repeat-containing protein n=1 Tax=Lactuca virosa TaxID=75947 RepID=A0AAU9MZA0_9ASTR|nr:unnamed protein product [Lactuca virosa]
MACHQCKRHYPLDTRRFAHPNSNSPGSCYNEDLNFLKHRSLSSPSVRDTRTQYLRLCVHTSLRCWFAQRSNGSRCWFIEVKTKMFWVIQKQDWYEPDVYLYKDLIIALSKKMEEAMKLWESMKKEINLYHDSQTYIEVIRGFFRFGSTDDAMNIYEDMKQSPDPPDELPFRILLKGLLRHPLILLRNKVKTRL